MGGNRVRYSQIKKQLKEAHAAGLKKIPRLGLYEKRCYFGAHLYGNISFTGAQILEWNFPVQEAVDYHYEKLQKQAFEKYFMEQYKE